MDFIKNNKTFFKVIPKKIVFAGITRDSSEYIEQAITRVKELGSLFKEYKIFVYENDSKDNTVSLLQKMRVPYISETIGVPSYDYKDTNRTSIERMAYYRNRLKESIDNESGDYVAIVDFDIKQVSWDGFFSSFQHEGWDIITAFGVCSRKQLKEPVYYDYFAHREIGQIGVNKDIVNKYKGELDHFIRVESAFGGIAIYKKDVYSSGIYSGEECEHVTFHRSLRENGHDKLFINTRLMVNHN